MGFKPKGGGFKPKGGGFGGKRVTGSHAREASTLMGNHSRASVHPTGLPHGNHDHHGELYERTGDGGVRQHIVHHDSNCNDVDKK